MDQFGLKFYDDDQDHNTEFDDPLLHSPHSTPHNYRVFLSNIARRNSEMQAKPEPPTLNNAKPPDDEIL